MKNEKWKPVVGYDGLYEVSDLGRIRSLNYGRTRKVKVLSPGISRGGYCHIVLCKNGKKKCSNVHILAVTAFRGPIPPGMEVNHINEDKTDNRLSNLEIVTHKENQNHGTRTERAAKANSKQLDLLEAEWPYREFTFPSSYEASKFFGYKYKNQVGDYISQARKLGRNFISLRKKKYFFSQAD